MEEGLRGEEDALWRKLRDLPTLFQLNIPRMAEASFSKVITKLRTEKRQVPEEFDEDVRSENLLAFLLLYIDKIEEAKPHIDSVLRKTEHDPNLVALGNICAYHLKMYNVSEAGKNLRTIDTVIALNDQVPKEKRAIAIGEQGYCLSRLGPKCYQMAAEKFREALSCGPPDYKLKIKWNYGLALCLDRLLDRHTFVEDPKFKPAEVYEEAQHCLALVTGSDIPAFCGKGWVALGEVHSKFVKIHPKYFEGNRKPEVLTNQQIDECFEKGLAVASDDHFVLERAGRHYRHRKRVDEAIKCLEKANEVRPSAFAWHHLGLAYRSKELLMNPLRDGEEEVVRGVINIGERHQKTEHIAIGTKVLLRLGEGEGGGAVRVGKAAAWAEAGAPFLVGLAEIHMQVGKHEEALQYFRKAAKEDNLSRSLDAASCYQKWGECFLQMGQEENGKNMLRKAVESAAKVRVEKRGAFATLVTLMQNEMGFQKDVRAERANELAQLYELVKRYSEALNFRKAALELKVNDPATLAGLVDNLRAQGDYTQARMYLSVLRGLTDVEVPKEVVIDVNLKAAQLQSQQDPHLARDIFLETFDFVFPTEHHPNVMYNVFVYSDNEDRERAETLTILCEEQYDLSCRCVHRDIPCTGSVVEMVADLINKSTCVIFVVSKRSLQNGMTAYVIGMAVQVVNKRGLGNLVTVNVDDCSIPQIISGYPSIKMADCSALQKGVNMNLFRKIISTERC
ncbi:uncharacterized protein LOC144862228 [Branchiostoma floridae x Branchiostoma japonicum]